METSEFNGKSLSKRPRTLVPTTANDGVEIQGDGEKDTQSRDEVHSSQVQRGAGTSNEGHVQLLNPVRRRIVQYPSHPYTTTKYEGRVLSKFFRNWIGKSFIEVIDSHKGNVGGKLFYTDMTDFFKKVRTRLLLYFYV